MIELPFGRGTLVRVEPGALLTVTVLAGRQLFDLCPEGFHQAMTRNVAGWRRFGRPSLALSLESGDALVDGEGTPLLVVEWEPAAGEVDVAYPGCWRELYPDRRPGCRDLIADALGLPRALLGGVVSVFGSEPRVGSAALHGWEGVSARPGARAAFRAARACTIAISACPDDGIPGVEPGLLGIEVS